MSRVLFILTIAVFFLIRVKSKPQSSPSPPPSGHPTNAAPTSPASPSPSSKTSSSESTLSLTALDGEVQKILDIISNSNNKVDDFLKLYNQYPKCVDRLAIERAYVASDRSLDSWSEEAHRFVAAFLLDCGVPAIVHTYHLADQLGREDQTNRIITALLVTSSESSETNLALEYSFNQRFIWPGLDLAGIVSGVLGDVDVRNVCVEIRNRKREALLDQPDTAKAEATAKELLDEENKTDGWKNERIKLDTVLMSSPLNQAKLVIEKFSKDGKDLKAVIEEDFKKDEDKKIAYLQLYLDHQTRSSSTSSKLSHKLNDYLYPMIILGAINKLEDLQQIESAFQRDHKDMNMRDKVKELTSTSKDNSPKFFQLVLDLQWSKLKAGGDQQSQSSPSPANVSPSPPT